MLAACGRLIGEKGQSEDRLERQFFMQPGEHRIEIEQRGVDQHEPIRIRLAGDDRVHDSQVGFVGEEGGREIGRGMRPEHQYVDLPICLCHATASHHKCNCPARLQPRPGIAIAWQQGETSRCALHRTIDTLYDRGWARLYR